MSIATITSVARAQPTTLPKPPEGAFEVYEWVIFLCDPNQPQANSSTLFQSTLPDFVAGRRNPAPLEKESEPGPVGVIRFSGSSGGEKIDVLLENKGGKFLAHWPKAQTRTTGVLWQNLVLSEQPPSSQEPLGASSWANRLRSVAAPFLLRDGRGEKFLLYDVEPNYKLPLRVSPGPADLQYQIGNTDTKAAIKELIFYKHESDGWHTAALAELPPAKADKPATKPATGPATKPTTSPAALATTQPATKPTTSIASSQPASQPSTKPTGPVVALTATGLTTAPQVLAPWRQKLTAAGLPPTDLDLILSILEKHALDSKRLTAVYRLEAEQLDLLLPIEVTPGPRKTVRVGLVIVRNIDPAIVTEIEGLVAQLGDVSWDKREAAQKALTQLGIAAKPKLEAMLKNARDPEIVYRVERLIAALTREPTAEGQPQVLDR